MVQISPFEVEAWMDDHETTAKYNIAETCAASVSIDDLVNLSSDKTNSPLSPSTKLVYGAIRGSDALRSTLAGLYSVKAPSVLPSDNILVTPGAIAANFLVFYTLLGAGDHVICHYPTYEQLYQVPKSLGAEVSLWRASEDNKWQLKIDDLKAMIKPTTKLLILNNPNNPTGAIIPSPLLEEIMDLAQEHNITILSDEVYRPLFHSISPADENFPSSALNYGYPNVLVTGSMSKAYSLAGIRLGWIASRNRSLIESIASSRHYTTISVSQLDDAVASFALKESTIHALLSRNIQLAKSNLSLLETFIERHRWACDWVKPLAGTTTFVRFHKMGKPIDDVAFCEALQEKKGVFFVPGSKCFGGGKDFKGYVRVGFVQEENVLKEGLEALKGFMQEEYENMPVAAKRE
ncbi:MAG: hypothetical protein Q9160_006139 [Pyrenula sp. 1 TL-2023]